jgi:hypothetical protein
MVFDAALSALPTGGDAEKNVATGDSAGGIPLGASGALDTAPVDGASFLTTLRDEALLFAANSFILACI